MNDDKAKKKIIVITGVTRGLGRAMAEKFIALGHTVLGCGRNQEVIEQLRQKCTKRHDFEVVDVTSDEQVQTWAGRLHKKCGAPDLVLNNAGIINPPASLWKVSAQDFSSVIDVNIKGTANVIRHFLPNMIKKHHGIVVNFSSGWGRSAEKDVAPYVATKWAIEGLSQALSEDLPPGMAAVPLNPEQARLAKLAALQAMLALGDAKAERAAKSGKVKFADTEPADEGYASTEFVDCADPPTMQISLLNLDKVPPKRSRRRR